MVKISIINEQNEFLSAVSRYIKKYYAKKGAVCNLRIYDSASAALFDLEDQNFDIYILDADMAGFHGIRLAEKIRERYREAYIIFVSAHVKYALEAFDVQAYRYIMKDQIYNKLENTLNSIEAKLELEDMDYYIVNTKSRYEKIWYKDIIYIYKDGKNSVIVMKDECTFTRNPIQNVYHELNQEQFIFIDRGCIVNILHIRKIDANEVYLRNNVKLAISRAHMNNLRETVYKYWKEGRA